MELKTIIESKNEIKNKLKNEGNKILIDKYVEYMMHEKEQTNLRNKLISLKILWDEINSEIFDSELELEKISDGKLNDEDLKKKINELEERFFDLLNERQIFEDAEEKLKFNQN